MTKVQAVCRADLCFQVSNALVPGSILRKRLLQGCQLGMQVALLGSQGLRCAVGLLQLPLAVLQALLSNVHLHSANGCQLTCWALPRLPPALFGFLGFQPCFDRVVSSAAHTSVVQSTRDSEYTGHHQCFM